MEHIWFPRASRRYAASPFGLELQDFADWLDEVGYSRDNIEGHLRRLYVALSESRVRRPEGWSADQLHVLFDPYCASTRRSQWHRGTQRVYRRFLAARGRLIQRPSSDPTESLQRKYRDYLSEVRGFTDATAVAHLSTVREFLGTVFQGKAFNSLDSGDIEQFLAHRGRRITRQTLQHIIAHLRSFLRYGFTAGLLPRRLDEIDTPRTYRDELPPRALPWAQVAALLRSVDRSSRAGWRDAAVLHLMAYYGLRGSEIATLRFDAIDWQARTVRVTQCKTRSDLILPLTRATLSLLRGYIKRERGSSALPYLFLRVRRPSGPLKIHGICDIFYKRAALSGLKLAGYSSYSLRHSFAMRLLQRNVGVKAIGDLLGHHSLEATCVYLRLDTTALRTVGLPLP